jgi:predicted ATPase
MTKRKLEKLSIRNFKSIREQTLELNSLNVLIGANGSGKSNLIQVFRFLREIANGNLGTYSLQRGVDALLFQGQKISRSIELYAQFGHEQTMNAYRITMIPTDAGTLAVDKEIAYFQNKDKYPEKPYPETISIGSAEACIGAYKNPIAASVRKDLESYRLYHFHDTSETSPMRIPCYVDDNRILKADGSNLAALLYMLQTRHEDHFRNIEDTVRQVAPFFDRFDFAPMRLNLEKIRLEWKEKGTDIYFNETSLSDGSLRFICLSTLLLQPVLPTMILLDEPELGLHPAAIALLADMLTSAATRTQLLVATQSVTLVNHLQPEYIWTAERKNGETVFKHLDKAELSTWLESFEGAEGYGLGDLWEKNLLGARP